MSTPLGSLIRSVLTDPDAQAAFASAPEAFLADHGYEDLDPQDLREAFYVLAEGSPPDTAARFVAGGDAIADTEVDDQGLGATATGLLGALGAFAGGEAEALDPSDLDGWDDDPASHTDADDDGSPREVVDERDDERDGDPTDDDSTGTAALTATTGAGDATVVAADHGPTSGPSDPSEARSDARTDLATVSDEHDAALHPGGDPSIDTAGTLDDDLLDTDPTAGLPDLDADLAPLVPDTTHPALPEDDPGDGWDDVI